MVACPINKEYTRNPMTFISKCGLPKQLLRTYLSLGLWACGSSMAVPRTNPSQWASVSSYSSPQMCALVAGGKAIVPSESINSHYPYCNPEVLGLEAAFLFTLPLLYNLLETRTWLCASTSHGGSWIASSPKFLILGLAGISWLFIFLKVQLISGSNEISGSPQLHVLEIH